MTIRLPKRSVVLVLACATSLVLGLAAAPAWAPPAGTPMADKGVITPNAREFEVAPGGGEIHGADQGFDASKVFFVQVTGADENVEVHLKDGSANQMVLRGETRSGIGQEDYVVTLPTAIHVTEVEVRCLADNPGPCRVFVHLIGTA